MKTETQTKKFPLRVLLTVTTQRLLTEPDDKGGNGIDQLYEILGWMTNDSPMTHQLPRLGEECRAWLLKWFPELGPCSVEQSLASLDRWIKADKTRTAQEGVRMWLTELKMMFPALRDEYDVPQIHVEDHRRTDPIQELVEMRESKEGIIVVRV